MVARNRLLIETWKKLSVQLDPLYDAHVKKRPKSGVSIAGNAKTGQPKKAKRNHKFREFVQSMLGEQGENLMEELMREKKREREL